MINGMQFSYNLATVRLAMEIGIQGIAQQLRFLGYTKPVNPYPSLALGAIEMSPLEVAELYQPIAAQGFKSEPGVLREIVDNDGEPVDVYSLGVEEKLSAESSYLLTWGMQKAAREGTGKSMYRILDQEVNAAGKTGTSDEGRDAWFAGFTGNYLAVVWIGNDDNKDSGITGATAALPVWANIMQQLAIEPIRLFKPEGIEWRWVSSDGYKLSAKHCQGSVKIPMLKNSLDKYEKGCGKTSEQVHKIKNWFKGLFE